MKEIKKMVEACVDESRLRILKLIEKRKMCVCELAFVLNKTQPSVSRHLKKLEKAGIITRQQAGYWTEYYIPKIKNKYAEFIINSLKAWLENEEQVKKDLRKTKGVLCCDFRYEHCNKKLLKRKR